MVLLHQYVADETITPIQEILGNGLALVAEAKYKFPVPVISVIRHYMAEDGGLAESQEWFGDILGQTAETSAEAAAEQNDFHGKVKLMPAAMEFDRSMERLAGSCAELIAPLTMS